MAELTSVTTTDTKTSAEDAIESVDDGEYTEASTAPDHPPVDYPYLRMLRDLQSKAIRAQADPAVVADDDDDDDDDDANEEEKSQSREGAARTKQQQQQPPVPPWDLSADALLATTLREFSLHVVNRTHRAATDVRELQDSVNAAGVDVAVCQTEFMGRSADVFMEQIVGDDESDESDDEDGSESDESDESDNEEGDDAGATADGSTDERKEDGPSDDDDDGSDDSSADIARLEVEERSAIADGMKALKLFFDPKRPNGGTSSGDNGTGGSDGGGEGGDDDAARQVEIIDAEEDIIGENCYYYPSAEGDGFNQRPLPFVVGSREFMESSCAGMGGDGGGERRGGEKE